MNLDLKVSLACDIGCKRLNNEDMILVAGNTYRNDNDKFIYSIHENDQFVAAVADGMGGHNAGEVASEIALKLFDEFIISVPKGLSDKDFKRCIENQIERIHIQLNQYGLNHKDCAGMGTTFAAWLVYDNRIYVINSGDSRIYRYRDGILCQLTVDHSERNRKNNSSIPSNQIYNCLGGGCNFCFADIWEITTKVFKDDIFLICSDGLSDMLSEDEIEDNLAYSDALNLVEKAKIKGGFDNISIILLTLDNIIL